MVLDMIQGLLDTSFWRVFRLHRPVDFLLPFLAKLIDEEVLEVLFLHIKVFDVAITFNGGIPEFIFIVPKVSLPLGDPDQLFDNCVVGTKVTLSWKFHLNNFLYLTLNMRNGNATKDRL